MIDVVTAIKTDARLTSNAYYWPNCATNMMSCAPFASSHTATASSKIPILCQNLIEDCEWMLCRYLICCHFASNQIFSIFVVSCNMELIHDNVWRHCHLYPKSEVTPQIFGVLKMPLSLPLPTFAVLKPFDASPKTSQTLSKIILRIKFRGNLRTIGIFIVEIKNIYQEPSTSGKILVLVLPSLFA